MIRSYRMNPFCGRRWGRIQRCGLWRRSMEDIAGSFRGGRGRRGFGRRSEWWSFARRFSEQGEGEEKAYTEGTENTEITEKRGKGARGSYSERMARICLP